MPNLRLFADVMVVLALIQAVTNSSAQTSNAHTQAETLVRQGEFDQGLVLLKQILENDPRNLRALNLAGIALTNKGQLPEANQQYQRALDVDPNFVPALKNLAINELAQKDLARARKHLVTALKWTPTDPTIHAYLGQIAYERQNFALAITHLSQAGIHLKQNPAMFAALVESYLETKQEAKALELLGKRPDWGPDGPAHGRIQFHLANVLAGRQLYQQAIPYFESAHQKFPDSDDLAFNLGLSYVETKQFSQAVQVLREVVDRGHKTAELDNLLAEAYEGNKQTQEAINTLREATQLEPEDEDNYVDLAALCTNYDAFDLGLEIIEIGLRHRPESERLIFQRGVIHAMQSEFDIAEQDFQLAARLAPQNNMSHVALGISYIQTGDLPKAITSLRQRINQKSNDSTLLYLLGEALIRSGANPDEPTFIEAKNALERSVKLNSKFPAARTDLAKLYLKENRVDDALFQLEKARALDPKEKSAYSQLAVAYRHKGDIQQANSMLKILNQLNDEERTQNKRQRVRLVKAEPAFSPPKQE